MAEASYTTGLDDGEVENQQLVDDAGNFSTTLVAKASEGCLLPDQIDDGNRDEKKPVASLEHSVDNSATTETPKQDSGAVVDTPEVEYELVDNESALSECLKQIQASLSCDSLLTLDCEGESLSRKGKLLLMSVATRKKAYLVDVLALGSKAFDTGFRVILEDPTIKKLMFDCREDADALQHQFNVKLDGVLDIQLLEVIKRPETREQQEGRLKRRSARHHEVVRLKSQVWCIENFLDDKEMLKQKEKGTGIMNKWGMRPLEEDQLNYAKTDVLSLFMLYEKLSPDREEKRRLEIASGVYVDLKRSIVERVYDQYENHGYLPMDVIPEKGREGFGFASKECVECNRRFPGDEFSKLQTRKGIQKCRTCKKVKEDDDRRMSRELQAQLEADRCDDFYGSDDYEPGYGHDNYSVY